MQRHQLAPEASGWHGPQPRSLPRAVAPAPARLPAPALVPEPPELPWPATDREPQYVPLTQVDVAPAAASAAAPATEAPAAVAEDALPRREPQRPTLKSAVIAVRGDAGSPGCTLERMRRRNVTAERLQNKLRQQLTAPFDPSDGGPDGTGDGSSDHGEYYEIARWNLAAGRGIARFLEFKTPPSIKNEETDVVHCINNEEHRGYEYDIPEDSYGAATLAIIKEMQQITPSGRASARLRGGFAMMLLILNLTLQVGILTFIDWHVVEPAVHHVQSIFKDYHSRAFDSDGTFQPARWDAYEGKRRLCQLGAASRFFYGVVLFVWVTAMLGEFRMSYYLLRNVSRMPTCAKASMMLVRTSDNICIVALTTWTRLLLYGLVVGPKFLISSYLLSLGCQWLSASTSFESLVLNTVAMEFVLHIDELLYKAFVPALYRRQVADINFFVKRPVKSDQEEATKAWKSYFGSLAYLVGALSMTGIYMGFLEDALPRDIGSIQDHCRDYLHHIQSQRCTGWGWSLDVATCYPFGTRP